MNREKKLLKLYMYQKRSIKFNLLRKNSTKLALITIFYTSGSMTRDDWSSEVDNLNVVVILKDNCLVI